MFPGDLESETDTNWKVTKDTEKKLKVEETQKPQESQKKYEPNWIDADIESPRCTCNKVTG